MIFFGFFVRKINFIVMDFQNHFISSLGRNPMNLIHLSDKDMKNIILVNYNTGGNTHNSL